MMTMKIMMMMIKMMMMMINLRRLSLLGGMSGVEKVGRQTEHLMGETDNF